MKYFAMIGDRRYGPMVLDEMEAQGVRPDTYVWCKGMDDWMQASEVPDICRYFRQRLSGTLPSQLNQGQVDHDRLKAAEEEEQERLLNQLPPMARDLVRKSGIKLTKENFPDPQQHFPKALPIILYVICLIVILIGFLIIK
ncbi:MAG: DUF4339 domain-containing protein [Muribaculaceae bacterium]|nr:DUF4339 domain-containing protein [Muribaculaceae bacterium]MDE6552481.1 DUF4339 domain-containing protein [Muribaculaceae bacterium]